MRRKARSAPVIPYLEMHPLRLWGFFQVQPFAALVLTGIFLGIWFGRKRARESGIPPEHMAYPIGIALTAGMLSAHALEVLLYFPERISQDGIVTLLRFWEGLSSYGGFLGAALGLAVYYRATGRSFLAEGDILVQGLVVGWIFGRAGCALVHDHPGRSSEFFLAVDFPGVPRHDLGLYELLYTLTVLLPLILVLHHRYGAGRRTARATRPARVHGRPKRATGPRARGAPPPPPGTYLAAVSLAYAPVRFALDFLRATDLPGSDRRVLGLTPGQYGSVALLAIGLVLVSRIRRRGRSETAG
jgi:phosphatidylglycerol---prolipoprotein diacylglyceryl transferase